MPHDTAQLIRSKIRVLAEDPATMGNVKKLTNADGYRLRVGGWRVVYKLEHDELLVFVVKISPRGEVYK